MSNDEKPTYPRYIDRAGGSLSLFEWALMLDDHSYRVLAFTQVSEGISVSTIWDGMSPNPFGGKDVFETAVFVDLNEPRLIGKVEITRDRVDGGDRASTEKSAFRVHHETVRSLLSDMGRTEPIQTTLPTNPATDDWYAAIRAEAAELEKRQAAIRPTPEP